ncbi:Gar1/Naf1 RNA binding region-domain-containing protein [Neurospora tetraspora]|uniref:H/ACA ribonucleoprotein complex non-core subunit NAF1 n=1 Tax=Neurospora tetraspora TaxID=94610 RepID=A0AAE0J784_9PEZI|nr:Gar1/Naf1 RNA binding region-domain-containing protein [Neurospora tetraspora]
MSGHPFQIPGLGQARPNEQLPADNFAPDLLVAAASIVGQDVLAVSSADPAQLLQLQKPKTEEKKDENAMEIDSKQSDSTPAKAQEDVSMANHGDNKQQTATENPTASNLDSPPSPDVTSTLEAALNGMLDAPTSSATMTNGEQDGAQEEEHPEWEEDSSPYESSSESSSDSSSDDDSDDEDAHPVLGVEETVRMLMAGLDEEEEDGPNKGKGAGAPLRTKNEVVEEVIPKPEVVITPEMKIEPLAHVEFIVENTVVMKSRVPGEVKVLDLGSVLCKEDRTVIGALAEIIGNVKSPLYTCAFANQDEIKELGLEVGTPIFYSVEHANYVFTQELKKQKGTDASNLHDEEVGADEMEFSDDEKEAEYKKQLKMKKRGGKAGRGGLREQVLRDQSYAPSTGYAPSASSATLDYTPTVSSATLNYDEDDDGPYRPLARPVGFGQGGPPSLPPKPEVGFNAAYGGQGQRGGFSRGNRGEFRGRGQRGGNRGADRRPGGHRGGRGGAAAPSYGGYDSTPAPPFPTTQLPPSIPQNAQIPLPPFGATPGAAPPMPGGHWPHIPISFPPPPISFPRPSTQSPVPPPQLAGAFNFNFQAWNQAQGQPYQYPQQSSSSSAPAPQQQSSTPSYPHQAPAVPPVWPGVPPPPPVAGAYVNPAFFQQLQAQHAQQAQQAQQPQQPQQPQQQQQQQQQYWGQHNAYGQAPK